MVKITRRNLLFLVLLISGAVALAVLWSSGAHGLGGFPLDDAWIHLVYGRSVAECGYPAYNTGIPSTGTTSPLWAYVLGLVHLVAPGVASPILGAKLAGILLHVLMTFCCFRIACRFSGSAPAGALTALILGFSPYLVIASLSGMEVSLACALSLAAISAYLEGRHLLAGVLFGLCGLTRPEFGAAIVVVFLDLLIRIRLRQERIAALVTLAIPVVSAAALFVGWNLWVDGSLFPASYQVKAVPRGGASLPHRLATGFGMLASSSPFGWGMAWAGLLGFPWASRDARRAAFLLLLAGASYLVGNLVLMPPDDPEAFYFVRYLIPSVPLLFSGLAAVALSGAAGAIASAAPGKEKAPSRWPILVRSVLVLCLAGFGFQTAAGLRSWTVKYARDCRNINEVQVEMGRAVDLLFGKDDRIGTIDAGAVRYFGKRFTQDLMGLNTKTMSLADCRDRPLRALVLIPAWVGLPASHGLVPIVKRQTEGYQVTSNPDMGLQVIAVCGSGSSGSVRELPFMILGRTSRVGLRCFTDREMDDLKRSAP